MMSKGETSPPKSKGGAYPESPGGHALLSLAALDEDVERQESQVTHDEVLK